MSAAIAGASRGLYTQGNESSQGSLADCNLSHVVVTVDGVTLSGDVDLDTHEAGAVLAVDENTGVEVLLRPEALGGGVKALLVAAAIQGAR